MNRQERISELLLRWEEMKLQGQGITTAELCQECPELIPELEEQIRYLRSIDALLAGSTHAGAAGSEAPAESQPPCDPVRRMSTRSDYEVLRSHAQGGLGEVLLARDHLLGREVALKVIRQPHDRDPDRRRRFVREAEITSRLEHPGIVPVHGIGQDRRGQLCYAMRFVTGESLQDAIRKFHQSPQASTDRHQRNLQLRQLLTRFVAVCNAIAYAHSQGIIHRDLKPSNIMLGAFGETLVVDWGLAKRYAAGDRDSSVSSAHDLAGSELEDSTSPRPDSSADLATRAGDTLGTPAFMSPEQSRGDPAIGPPSDIYSLGSTIYMLLTGQPPFHGRSNHECLDALRQNRFLHPRQVKADIPKSLEAVCLKAMALEPPARYASALELAADIERWLADEPVSAYPESWSQRCQRWIRRHQSAVTSIGASVFVGLVCATLLLAVVSRSNEQLRIANRQEVQAKSEAETHAANALRSAAIARHQSELALRSLQAVTFDIQRQLKNVPAAHQVRRRLLDVALQGLQEVAASLEQRPQVDHSLMIAHRDLGEVFFEVGGGGDVRGTDAALVQFQRAYEIAKKLVDASPANREAMRQLAVCHDKLGDVHDRTGAHPAAEEQYQRALDLREQLLAADQQDEQALRDLSVSLNKLGDLRLKAADVEEARSLFVRALAIRQEQAARNVVDPQWDRDLGVSYNKLGRITLRLGDAHKALLLLQEGFAIFQRRAEQYLHDDQAQRDLSSTYDLLSQAAWVTGDFESAAKYAAEAFRIDTRRAVADPNNTQIQRDVMQSSERMAERLTKLGKQDEAQPHWDKAITICEELAAADPADQRLQRDLANAYSNQGDRLAARSQHADAIAWYHKSLAKREQLRRANPADVRASSEVAFGLTKLGDGLLESQQVEKALQCYTEALQIHQQRGRANPTDRLAQSNLAAYHQRLGVACRRVGRFDQAAENYQQGLAIVEKLCEHVQDDVHVRIMTLTFYHGLGFLEQSRDRFPEARQWYDRGLVLARQLSSTGKLVGENATWVSYIEDAIRDCQAAEQRQSDERSGSRFQALTGGVR